MKKIYYILSALFLCVVATSAQEAGKTVVIKTNVGTMKAILYDDVPNHTRTFIERAKRGDFNGTLFTRVLPEFMIQGGAPDSKNAPAGAKCGFGDPSAEIPPEINEKYFHKKGALAAPRQPDDINPQKKSDMSQFFIVQGKVYRETELDTLERTANYPARQKALKEFYITGLPVCNPLYFIQDLREVFLIDGKTFFCKADAFLSNRKWNIVQNIICVFCQPGTPPKSNFIVVPIKSCVIHNFALLYKK